jgi:hypothetical protein
MAAQAGTVVLVGQSGRTYTLDLYVPDAVATNLTFNPAGLAASTSPSSWRAPEKVTIVDVSIGTAPTAVGCTFQANYTPINGATIRWANQLAANPNRPKLRVGLNAGDIISALQF